MSFDKKESYPIVAGQVAFEGIHKLIYKSLNNFTINQEINQYKMTLSIDI
jgi:hypothetical protein